MMRSAFILSLLIAWGAQAAPPVEMRPPKTDSFGDPLPPGAIARLGTMRWKISSPITAVAFSPDGKRVATATHVPQVQIWDYPSGILLQRHNLENNNFVGPHTLVFTADQRRLDVASTDATSPVAIDLATGRLSKLGQRASRDVPTDYRLSPDGLFALEFINDVGNLRMWLHDLTKHGPPKELMPPSRGETIAGFTIALSPGAKWVGIAAMWPDSEGRYWASIRLLNTATNNWWSSKKFAAISTSDFAFAPDGKSLVIQTDKGLVSWEIMPTTNWDGVPQVKTLRQFSPSENGEIEQCPTFSPDGKLLAALGATGDIGVWDTATGKLKWRRSGRSDRYFLEQTGRLRAAPAFSPDGKTLIVPNDLDGRIRLFDAATGGLPQTRVGHGHAVAELAFHTSGQSLVSLSHANVRTWDLTPRRATVSITDHKTVVEDRISSREYAAFRFETQADGSSLLALDKGGQQLFIAESGIAIHHFDVASRRVCRTTKFGNFPLHHFGVSPDGQTLATASIGGIKLIEAKSGNTLPKQPDIGEPADTVMFGSDGRFLSAISESGRYFSWDLLKGKEGKPIPTLRQGIVDRYLASYRRPENAIMIWDRVSGRLVRVFEGNGPLFALSPDGRYLASAAGMYIALLETWSGKSILHWENGERPVASLKFSLDGRMLAAGYDDGTILLWNAHWVPDREIVDPWKALADEPAIAFPAMQQLAADRKKAMDLLKSELKPAKPLAPNEVAALLADLSDDNFKARERATKKMQAMASQLEDVLELALWRADLDAERRIQRILHSIQTPFIAGDDLRVLRAIDLLERIGTPEARALLEKFAKSDGLPAREARDSLARLSERESKTAIRK